MQATLVSFLPPFSVHVSLKGKSLPIQEQFLSIKNRPMSVLKERVCPSRSNFFPLRIGPF